MKKHAFLLTAFAVVVLPLHSLLAKVGSITVTTTSQAHRTSKSTVGDTTKSAETRQTGVLVHYGLMQSRDANGPYEVQCFFVANGNQIYDTHKQVSDLPVDAEFMSRSLVGKTTSLTISSIDIQFTGSNQTASGTLSSYSESKGRTSVGWIVRVLEAGKIVFVTGSLSELKAWAVSNPEKLDAIISKVKPTAPQPDAKPATGFGNTSLDHRPK
jgi:hypothetical protein